MFENVIMIFLSILLFFLLLLAHEFGHFFTAKLFGVKVKEFSIGMGPAIYKKLKGETLYSIRSLPLGGYCELDGKTKKEPNNSRSLANLPVYKRAIVTSAGAFMNIIIAFLFMSIVLVQKNQYASTTISKFTENAVTCNQGLRVNDKIIKINDFRINTFSDISFALATNNSEFANVTVIRRNDTLNFESIKFKTIHISNKKSPILVRDFFVKPVNKNFFSFIGQVFGEIFSTVRVTCRSFWLLLTGRLDISDMSGPIGIVDSVKTVAKEGLKSSILDAINSVLFIMSIISVNLGVMNLMPIPALDGGRIVFLLLEALLKHPIKPEIEEKIHQISFIILFALIVMISLKDLYKMIFIT